MQALSINKISDSDNKNSCRVCTAAVFDRATGIAHREKKKGHAVHSEMKSMSFLLFKEIYFKEIYFFAPCFATAFILASIAAWSPR